jgi:hypothetical protein
MTMKRKSLQSLVAFTLAITIAATYPLPSTRAQSAPETSNEQQSEPTAEFPPEVENRRIDKLEFNRWPLMEVIRHLRGEFPNVNFIVPDDQNMDNVTIRLRLRSVGLRDILNAISFASHGKSRWEKIGKSMVGFRMKELSAKKPMAGDFTESEIQTDVFNIPRALGTSDQETINEALAQAVRVVHNAVDELNQQSNRSLKMPDFHYHRASGLLILTGSKTALRLAIRVLEEIAHSIEMKAGVFAEEQTPSSSPDSDSEQNP